MRALGWSLIQHNWYSHKKREFGQRDRHTNGKGHVKMKTEIKQEGYKARNAKTDGKPRARRQTLPHTSQKQPSLLTL
jgi:hypothetical protein